MSMFILAACLLAGFLAGRFAKLPQWMGRLTGWALSACLFALVLTLGYKLGGDSNLIRQFGSIGVGALALALGCTAGSILAVKAFLTARALARGRQK